MKTAVFLTLFLFFFPLNLCAQNEQENPIAIKKVNISAIQNEQTHELAKEVVRAAYKKIGVVVEFSDLPARRALEWANSGKTDGDLARIDGTEKSFTNLIKISTPVIDFKGVAFTKNIVKEINSWEDLKGLSIGIIGGIRYSEMNSKNLNRIFAKDMTQLFKLLEIGHIDIAVAVLDAGKIELHRNFKDSEIHVIGKPLYSSSLFHFLHKRNENLKPQLEGALQEMQKKGDIKTICDEMLIKVLSQ